MNNLPDFGNGKTILIAPLNWGLGHATRLIPIVKHYNKTHRILLAGNQPSLSILTHAFPCLETIELPEQTFFFDSHFFSLKNLFRFSHRLNKSIRKDHEKINDIIIQLKVNIIISDNRYGLWHPDTYNILVTHQLMLKLPAPWIFLKKQVHRKVLQMVRKFNECWIPDFPDKENLSGDLSHRYPLPENAKFIGPLSRFQSKLPEKIQKKKNVLVILSGPEPQRTTFEKKLETFLAKNKIPATILLGKPNYTKTENKKPVIKIPHTSDNNFLELVRNHSIIISRAGYSTIMDFYFLQKPVILIPTPKQTEQIYLAKRLNNHKLFTFVEEKDIEDYLLGKYFANLKAITKKKEQITTLPSVVKNS